MKSKNYIEKILVLDNYDSFTYNLVHYLKELSGLEIDVFRNDEITLEEVEMYSKILLSPGPGIPEEAGILKDLIRQYGPTKSIMGVCLGCQAIAEVYGGQLTNLDTVYHGVATKIKVLDKQEELFSGMEKSFMAGRYHSWIVSREGFPGILQITALDETDVIMALRHKKFNVRGVQFHPESILTPNGKTIIRNWLEKY